MIKRVRRVIGTSSRPRLCVFRSSKAMYAQVIDDTSGHTLLAASSREVPEGIKSEQAEKVGVLLAQKALKCGIKSVVFDRRRYRYHGRVARLAAGAREGGLQF